jgi:hypothetical protein
MTTSEKCKHADLATGQADWVAYVDDAISVHSDEEYTICMGDGACSYIGRESFSITLPLEQ